jgi:hypothetical protein
VKTTIFLCVIGILIGCAQAQLLTAPTPRWKVMLKVVDDTGSPVAGAEASVGYLGTHNISGLTDTNGVFIASHRDKSYGLGILVTKDHYYPTRQVYDMGWAFQYDKNKARWNPSINLTLERILKPIPMYARNSQIELPIVDKGVGFDLMKYDWVAPYGKGSQSDIVFQAKRRWVSRNDFDSNLVVMFPNSGDGLFAAASIPGQGSEGPRISTTAPLDGYVPQLQRELSNTPSGGWKDDGKNQNYFFRVRTALDENGHITSALYGKIYGDFALDPINSKTTWILFTYYLNPTPNSRNLEFDPNQNLFTGIKSYDRVMVP